jgi:hypothetical protein
MEVLPIACSLSFTHCFAEDWQNQEADIRASSGSSAGITFPASAPRGRGDVRERQDALDWARDSKTFGQAAGFLKDVEWQADA